MEEEQAGVARSEVVEYGLKQDDFERWERPSPA